LVQRGHSRKLLAVELYSRPISVEVKFCRYPCGCLSICPSVQRADVTVSVLLLLLLIYGWIEPCIQPKHYGTAACMRSALRMQLTDWYRQKENGIITYDSSCVRQKIGELWSIRP